MPPDAGVVENARRPVAVHRKSYSNRRRSGPSETIRSLSRLAQWGGDGPRRRIESAALESVMSRGTPPTTALLRATMERPDSVVAGQLPASGDTEGSSGRRAVGRRARASMVRRQRVGQRRRRAGSEVAVERRLRVGEPGLGLGGGAREGPPAGRRAVEAAEAAVERLQRRQQQAERDQTVSDDPEDEPGGLLLAFVPRPGRAAEHGAGEADAPERAGRGETVTGPAGAFAEEDRPDGDGPDRHDDVEPGGQADGPAQPG